MNLKIEEILMVIVAFLIGWFVSNMISGSSSDMDPVKAVGGKHYTDPCDQYPHNKDTKQVEFVLRQCDLRINDTPVGNTARNLLARCYNIDDPDRAPTGNGCRDLRTGSANNENPEELIKEFMKTVGPQEPHHY